MKEKIKCWEFFDCNKKQCPVYRSKELNCWLVSGTHCRDEIQGRFPEKAEMCLDCKVFEANLDGVAMGETVKILSERFKTYRTMVQERDEEWARTSMELALGLSEVFVALKEIAAGNPDVRVPETSDMELLSKLKHMVNETAANIGEIVDLSHEFAMGLAEHFDALHRVSTGDLSARVTGTSQIELLESLKSVTNETIESVAREIAERKEQEAALRESEARFRNMADNAPVMVWVTEADGSCSFVSKSWCDFTGQTLDATLGFGWLDAIHPDDLERSEKAFVAANQKHEAFQLEYRVRRKDGQYRWAIDAAAPRVGPDGEFLGYVGSVLDISERKEAEEAVRFERAQLLSIFDSISQIIYISDPQTYEILYVNNKAREIFKKPLIGHICYKAFQGLDVPCAFCTNDIIQKNKYKPYQWEHNNPVLNRDFMVIDRIMKWPDGRDVRFEIAIDITKRKKAEEALRASERTYSQLVQGSPDAIISLDSTGNFLSFNKTAGRMTGFSEEEVVGKHFAKIGILPRKSIAKAVKEFVLIMKGKKRQPFELGVKPKDKSVLFMEANPQLIRHEGKKPWVQVVLRDITERVKAEKALRESEKKYRALFEGAAEGILVADIETKRFKYSNAAMRRMLGYSEEELTRLDVSDIHPKEALEHVISEFEAQARGDKKLAANMPCLRKDGTTIYADINTALISMDGTPCNVGFFSDITDRKIAEEALRESQERYKSVLENIGIGVALISPDMEILSLNRQMKEWFPSVDETGKPICYRAFNDPPRSQVCDYCPTQKTLSDGQCHEAVTSTPTDRGIKHYRIVSTPIMDDKGKVLNAIEMVEDITEKTRAEEEKDRLERQLQRAQKMEAVATLVGGLAHDFNNLLSMTMGNISMAKDDVKPEHGIYQFLDEAEKASMRAKDLTRRLMSFADGGAPVKRSVNIKALLEEWVHPGLTNANVRCEVSIAENLWPIECDEGQMRFAVDNLVVNAVEAMPHGGTIKVHAENLTRKNDKEISGLPMEDGEYLHMSIRDDGMGISKKDLPRIFDPYFSTKEMGTQKGMGLGLSTAYSVIDRHKGHITVESEVGVGTNFDIYLPACPQGTVKTEYPNKGDGDGRGRVLMMDDEEMLRSLTSQMLVRLGYETETAEDGIEAVEKYKEARDSGKPFDAVVLDLTIRGGMGGKATMEVLLGIDPQVKAIACSGYCEDPVMENCRKHGFKGSLLKPFRKKDLEEALGQVMREASK